MAQGIIASLRINLGMSSAEFDQSSSRVKRQAKSLEGSLNTSFANIGKMAAGLGAALAGAFAVGKIADAADSWSDMSSRVGNAVGSMDAAPEVLGRIAQMARDSYSPLVATTDSFIANSQALKDLGFSTEKQLDFTEALNNALVISAARGDKATAVQKALSDGMATGKLSGDGFNTILTSGGRVAQALAKELGTTVTGLRQFQKDGKITSAVISGALLNSMQELRAEAAEMPATIADGRVLLANGFTQLIGSLDGVTGASGSVATVMVGIADAMVTVAKGVKTHADVILQSIQMIGSTAAVVGGIILSKYLFSLGAGFVATVRQSIIQTINLERALGAQGRGAIAASVGTKLFTASLRAMKAALISTGIGALVVAAGLLVSKFIDLVRSTGSFGGAMTALKDVAVEAWDRIGHGAVSLVQSLKAGWLGMKSEFNYALHDMLSGFSNFMGGINKAINDTFRTNLNETPMIGALTDIQRKANDAAEGASTASARAASSWEAATAPLESLKTLMGEVADAQDTITNPTEPTAPTTPDSGDGKKGGGKNKTQDIVDGLKKQYDALKATKGMTEAQITTWQALRDAGVGATSAIGQQITKLTTGIASMTVLNDLTAQLEKVRATAGMTARELKIFESQQAAGVSGDSDAGRQIAGMVTEIDKLESRKTMIDGFRTSLSGMFGDILSGTKSGKEAFKSLAASILTSLTDKALQSAMSGFMGGGAGGGGGLLGGIMKGFKIPGFSSGGYTGNGGRGQAAGIVHGQEFVLNAAATKRIGLANLNAMNSGRDFGAMNRIPARPSLGMASMGSQAAGAMQRQTVDVNVNLKDDMLDARIDQRATGVASSAVKSGIQQYDKGMPARWNQIRNDPRGR